MVSQEIQEELEAASLGNTGVVVLSAGGEGKHGLEHHLGIPVEAPDRVEVRLDAAAAGPPRTVLAAEVHEPAAHAADLAVGVLRPPPHDVDHELHCPELARTKAQGPVEEARAADAARAPELQLLVPREGPHCGDNGLEGTRVENPVLPRVLAGAPTDCSATSELRLAIHRFLLHLRNSRPKFLLRGVGNCFLWHLEWMDVRLIEGSPVDVHMHA
mmetsp:Transcript_35692/g.96852  ORF Transcript_35692/g.96852 Transcript_35692/m.96852 type:complete len:215 (+) Transcript_35692:541-1185(+)